jgi:hypothetical protein
MLDLLQSHPELVRRIPTYAYRRNGQVEQFKAVAELVDGSRLHINEVWIEGNLHKYAYYQVTLAGEIIQGWDNAPHHPEVNTHPHHLHREGMVISSSVRSLADVLQALVQPF